ncbi:MAG: GNAT family N-acetyltransferase, partial [Myxococcus sp.]|nr:GNAT family N-acetyltransferase [Myxococcus sp.]
MTDLSVQALGSLTELRRHCDAIDALNLASRRPCPFSTLEYLETFLAHDEFGAKEAELLALLAFDAGQLVGYLPLRRHRAFVGTHLPYTRVGVMVSHDTDRPHVVARPEDEARCAQAFYGHLLGRKDWSLLELNFQDAESALSTPPPPSPLRYWVRRYENMPISRLPVAWKDLGGYLATLSKSRRKVLVRSLRRTFQAGQVEAVSSSDPAGLGELLALYLDVEHRSWKEAARAGVGRDPRRVAFFEALMAPGQPMPMTAHLLVLDGLPVAGAVVGVFGGVMHALEICFDQDYEHLGCGHVGGLLTFRQASALGLREVNLNGNYAYNKANLGAEPTLTWAVQVYRVGSLPWLKAQAGRARRWLRPPPAEAPQFNPERRAHETHAAVRPARDEERARAKATLDAVEARGVTLERLSGAALEAALGLTHSTEAQEAGRRRIIAIHSTRKAAEERLTQLG